MSSRAAAVGVEFVDDAGVLANVDSRTKAELIFGTLRSHGLAAVAADDAGGQYPQLHRGRCTAGCCGSRKSVDHAL